MEATLVAANCAQPFFCSSWSCVSVTWADVRKITAHSCIHIAEKCQGACAVVTKIVDQGKLF